MKNQITGSVCEQIAAQYLQQKGIIILVKNYRNGKNEIDLIGKSDNTLIFFEVKYRKNNDFGTPEQTVSKKQKSCIKRAANGYINGTKWMGEIRFDIIAMEGNNYHIEHFEDAF